MSVVLVTGAGGAAVPGIIERLKADGHRVVAADTDPYAVGLYLADEGVIVPPGNSSEFDPALGRVCSRAGITVIVPLVDEELKGALRQEEENGIPVLVPRRPFLERALDKLELMACLSAARIAVPMTTPATDPVSASRFPVIVKPRVGRGSRGVYRVDDAVALSACLSAHATKPEGLIVQDYIAGAEYTVSVTVWRDGRVLAVVPKEVILKRGITRIAVTRRHPAIERLCHSIQEKVRADGPFNVQLRLAQDGTPLPFEINPRFSTTVSLTAAAGVNEIGSLVNLAAGLDPGPFTWRDGVVLLRRTTDEFLSESTFLASAPRPA